MPSQSSQSFQSSLNSSLTLFQRAHRRLPLTPEERAILKFIYLSLLTATTTGLTAVVQYLGAPGRAINWQVVSFVFIGAFSATLFETARKWVTAHGDGPLGAALQVVAEAAKRTDVVKQIALALPASPTEPAK